MAKIYLLTAPFDEEAKTGDGQYAASLELGFAENYDDINCTWLKKEKGHYSIPFPAGTTSIPQDTIPSAIVLQPVANERTIISGYKLNDELSPLGEAQEINEKTASPRTPKVIIKHDNSLQSLTIMDIYSHKPITFDALKVEDIIRSLELKEAKLALASESNKDELSKYTKEKTKLTQLIKIYNKNEDNIQNHCSLNEYIEYHLRKDSFIARNQTARNHFNALKAHFNGPVNFKELEKVSDKLTGIKEYSYDFHSKSLPYDLARDTKFRNFYGLSGLKGSIETIIGNLEAINHIRLEVAKEYPHSLRALDESDASMNEKLNFIDKIFNEGFKSKYDKETFIHAVLTSNVEEAIQTYTSINNKLIKSQDVLDNKAECRTQLISQLQTLMLNNKEPYRSENKKLSGFYSKKILSTSEGFHLAYQANRQDPIKPHVINEMIESMQPIDENTHLDIHIRPPDCGVFITPEDIKKFQDAGIKVNITIHEYKQNYTRRYLQQYTHDLMRQANSIQFFNAADRDNAIIAATYGDCDKRNTTEKTGIDKKKREVGKKFDLDKYPVHPYDLQGKSGLTVASQKLSTAPSNPLDVVLKEPNILSFGTIRPGKGFEEALILAQLVNRDKDRMKIVPIVKLAGDPQDKNLMQMIVVERFGEAAVKTYQSKHPFNNEFSNKESRNYWKNLVAKLNGKVQEKKIKLNNPYIEIHPWCEEHELLTLKKSCKYVCRMDDMGMRNNGSAIISVLDVGIVYTKFGSVTDDIFTEGGQYSKAVDIGKYRYGKYSLLKKEEDFLKQNSNKKVPKWLIKNPDSGYKRLPESRDPQDILNSIIEREENQLECNDVKYSNNYQTILEAQKLLTERFTLKNAVEHLLENIGLKHLIREEEVDDLFDEVDPLSSQLENLKEFADIKPQRFSLSRSCPDFSLFSRERSRLENDEESNKLKSIKVN